MSSPSIVWFRDDLRLTDNPALTAAVERGEKVIGVFVLDELSPGIRPLGGAAKWWLHNSLAALRDSLRELGGELVLRSGAAADALPALVEEAAAGAVFWNRRYGLPERSVDAALKSTLRERDIEVASFAASLLFEPWSVLTGGGTPYSVFTPFWRALLSLPEPRRPLAKPDRAEAPRILPSSESLDDWRLLPREPDWADGLRSAWVPGEDAAHERLRTFLADDLSAYDRARDEPAAAATSLLSARLRWGELSPHTIWHEARPHGEAAMSFLREVAWREFAWHTLFHNPDLATKNLRPSFDAFPWPEHRPELLNAWQHGRTGIPLVDAGMHELWSTGTMHNRVRMVAASFLVKNLLIDWRHGEEWFWDTLVDADAASNPFNWQWVAGSGADAAPYFRVFNPLLQASKFDPQGLYLAQWAPEHTGTDGTLAPTPIVDLADSRRRALDAYERMRSATRPADSV